jgi:hypothetical protein
VEGREGADMKVPVVQVGMSGNIRCFCMKEWLLPRAR